MWDDIPSGGGNNGESVLAWSAHRRGYREHRRPSEENIWMGLTLQPPKHSERREIKRLSKRLGMAEIAYDAIKGKHIYIYHLGLLNHSVISFCVGQQAAAVSSL